MGTTKDHGYTQAEIDVIVLRAIPGVNDPDPVLRSDLINLQSGYEQSGYGHIPVSAASVRTSLDRLAARGAITYVDGDDTRCHVNPMATELLARIDAAYDDAYDAARDASDHDARTLEMDERQALWCASRVMI